MTKKKPTLADAGKDIEEGINHFWDWRHGVDKRLLELGQKSERNGVDIRQLLSEIAIAKQLIRKLNDIDDALRGIRIRATWTVIFWGMFGGFLAFGLLILFALWYFR